MFSVAVIRLKDLIKYVIAIIFLIIVIVIFKPSIKKIRLNNANLKYKISYDLEQHVKKAINLEIPEAKLSTKQDDKKLEEQIKTKEGIEKNILNKILSMELGALEAREMNDGEIKLASIDNTEESEKQEKNVSDTAEEKEDKQNIELAKTDVQTKVITKDPLVDAYTQKFKSVKIKNETSFDLTDKDLNYDNLRIDKSNIIIFHTHTCESYTSSEQYSYTPTGNFRTTDRKYSVVRVGDELTKYLKKYDINVNHDKTYHDYPSYNGSYSRSLATVSNILKNTKADIVIDLHRDAIGSNSSYAPTVKIGDEECAQLMFVMGSDGGGLKHPNWKSNLQFAIKTQEIANKTYPGLFKPIILRNSRYNQNLSKAACIIEVGSTGNTLEQCLNSMKYLSEVINEFN